MSRKTNLPIVAFIALGSNLGDSVRILREAAQRLQSLSDVPIQRSSIWESTPVDCPDGSPNFVNAAVALQPRRSETPESLLAECQRIENELGRQTKRILNEPRILDLDLIAFGTERRFSSQLTLPHPRAHLRRFVLKPLSEIAPDIILPGQKRTVAELLAALESEETLNRIGGLF